MTENGGYRFDGDMMDAAIAALPRADQAVITSWRRTLSRSSNKPQTLRDAAREIPSLFPLERQIGVDLIFSMAEAHGLAEEAAFDAIKLARDATPQIDTRPHPPPGNTRKKLRATPFIWRDPATIPPRDWLYGRHYIRQFTSATIAAGGLAKTSFLLVEAVASALKRPLVGIAPAEPLRVWYWNGEDPRVEIERRIAAICQRYELNGRDLEGWLFLDSGRVDPVKLAALASGRIAFDNELVADIAETIANNRIDICIFDPFISTHDVPESDNNHIDAVAKKFGHIADEANISIELAHHVRKPANGSTETTVDDARGASALVNAVRVARVLNRMTPKQAEALKIGEPWRYFRADDGKFNLAPPELASWHHFISVDLPNGDNVGVVEPWKYPSPLDCVTVEHMQRVRQMAAQGSWRADARSPDWIGRAVADVVGLDPDGKADMETIKAALKAWLANGVLTTIERKDEQRKDRKYVVPGDWNEGSGDACASP